MNTNKSGCFGYIGSLYCYTIYTVVLPLLITRVIMYQMVHTHIYMYTYTHLYIIYIYSPSWKCPWCTSTHGFIWGLGKFCPWWSGWWVPWKPWRNHRFSPSNGETCSKKKEHWIGGFRTQKIMVSYRPPSRHMVSYRPPSKHMVSYRPHSKHMISYRPPQNIWLVIDPPQNIWLVIDPTQNIWLVIDLTQNIWFVMDL